MPDDASLSSLARPKQRSFVDGNKRIALAIGDIFLEVNGISLNASEPETVVVFERLASGNISEADLSSWFEIEIYSESLTERSMISARMFD